MASSQTPQQPATMGAVELKSCCSAPPSPHQVSAINAENNNINTTDNTEAVSPLGSTIQGPPLSHKAKRKNHRGGKRKKKGKGKRDGIDNAEKLDGNCSEKQLRNAEKERIVLDLESEAAPVANAEVPPSKGKCNEDNIPAQAPTEDHHINREEGASTVDEDGTPATIDLDDAINKKENESINLESITTTISMFDGMVIKHGWGNGATGAKEAPTFAAGEAAATTADEAKTTMAIAEDETAITGTQEAVVVEPSGVGAHAAVVDGVDVEKESAAAEVIAVVLEEYAVEEGKDAIVAVEQHVPIEAANFPLVVEVGGHDLTAKQDFTTTKTLECQTRGHDGGETLPMQEPVPAEHKEELQQPASLVVQKVVDCMYEIKLAPGKGLGMFAKSMIRRGVRIIEEEALMVVPEMSYSAVLPVFACLGPKEKAVFMELAGAEDEDEAENLAWYMAEADKDVDPRDRIPMRYEDQAAVQLIFGSNSFNMTAHTSGIFPIASRMNHSCIPNVYHTWNRNINRLTVHALRNIAPGEELLTTYISAILTREQRNDDEHLGNYGFTCSCPACNPKSKFFRQSVFRRASAAAVEEQMASYLASGNLRDAFVRNTGPLSSIEALRYAKIRVNLLMEEGIMNMDLVKCIHEAGKLALLCGEFEEARTCAKTAVWLTETCAGKDSAHIAVLRNQLIEAERKLRFCWGDDGQQGRRVCV